VLQLLMEADVEGLIGAGRYERSGERTTWRNGHRDRMLDTRLGSLQLRIPKPRQGNYFPPFLEARKVSEKALIAVIQEALITNEGAVSAKTAAMLAGRSKSSVGRSTCRNTSRRNGAASPSETASCPETPAIRIGDVTSDRMPLGALGQAGQ
jgi:putative transposase